MIAHLTLPAAGTTGHLLAEAPLQGVDVACVLVPAAANYPDARSAFVVVKSLEKARDTRRDRVNLI